MCVCVCVGGGGRAPGADAAPPAARAAAGTRALCAWPLLLPLPPLTSCSASMDSAVHLNGSGATWLPISLTCSATATAAPVLSAAAVEHRGGAAAALGPSGRGPQSSHTPCKAPQPWPPTSLAKGSLRMSRSVDFWYLRISRSATVPAL
jgi:hypothetical protein